MSIEHVSLYLNSWYWIFIESSPVPYICSTKLKHAHGLKWIGLLKRIYSQCQAKLKSWCLNHYSVIAVLRKIKYFENTDIYIRKHCTFFPYNVHEIGDKNKQCNNSNSSCSSAMKLMKKVKWRIVKARENVEKRENNCMSLTQW